MSKLQLELSADNFGLIWRALHAEEEKLQEIINSNDEESDEAIDAANDMVYLRLYREELKGKAESIFGSSVFVLDNSRS